MIDVQGYSSDSKQIGKPVTDLMKAHQLEELKFENRLGKSMCTFGASFPGGNIIAYIK